MINEFLLLVSEVPNYKSNTIKKRLAKHSFSEEQDPILTVQYNGTGMPGLDVSQCLLMLCYHKWHLVVVVIMLCAGSAHYQPQQAAGSSSCCWDSPSTAAAAATADSNLPAAAATTAATAGPSAATNAAAAADTITTSTTAAAELYWGSGGSDSWTAAPVGSCSPAADCDSSTGPDSPGTQDYTPGTTIQRSTV